MPIKWSQTGAVIFDRSARLTLLDECGQPLSPRVEQVLVSLAPKFQRHFPSFRDDLALVEALEEAGCKIVRREARTGPIERLHAYAWVTLRSVATSHLRRGPRRLEQRTLTSHEGEAAIESTPARFGSQEELERSILLRELLDRLPPAERVICVWRIEGLSSQEIAERRGGTAAAVDTLLSRIRRQLRTILACGGSLAPQARSSGRVAKRRRRGRTRLRPADVEPLSEVCAASGVRLAAAGSSKAAVEERSFQ